MNSASFVRYIIEYSMILVCAAMCYIPVMNKLKMNAKKLIAIIVPILLVYTAAGAALSTFFSITPNTLILAAAPIFFLAYRKTLMLGFTQCLFIFMYVCSMMCYPSLYAIVFDALNDPEGSYKALSVKSLLVQYAAFLMVFAVYVLARDHIRWLTENFYSRSMRRFFWIIPAFYTVIAIIIIPHNYSNLLYRGRSIVLYPIIITAFFISEIAIVFLFYKITRETIYSANLLRQNQLLETQAHQYEDLRSYMEHTKQLRHDFRQQILTMSSLAENKKYNELSHYLSEYSSESFSLKYHSFCENSAVDAILGYYYQSAAAKNIITDWRLILPEKLPIPEPVFCGMLGNLIENAIDGCETVQSGEKIIHLCIEMRGASILVLVIENTFDGRVRKKDGSLMSTKHDRNGIGLESARATAEKYGGQMRIDYTGKTFCVNILLNS